MEPILVFPIPRLPIISTIPDGFTKIDFTKYTEMPINDHPGAFGYKRKNHRHEGVDLYADEGTNVYAIEDGIVTLIEEFTGQYTNPPTDWWADTQAVHVEGQSYVLVYGEIRPEPLLKVGQQVKAGDLLGQIVTVLKKDKGRPMAMLHLEMHTLGNRATYEWPVDGPRPESLQDPTPLLFNIIQCGIIPKP